MGLRADLKDAMKEECRRVGQNVQSNGAWWKTSR